MATHAWSTADVMTEAEVVALMGRERFRRLKSEGWICPFRKGFAQDVYPRQYTLMRLEDDRRLYPDDVRLVYDRRQGHYIAKALRPGPPLARSGAGHTVA